MRVYIYIYIISRIHYCTAILGRLTLLLRDIKPIQLGYVACDIWCDIFVGLREMQCQSADSNDRATQVYNSVET